MDNNPLVSIIMSVYNTSASFLQDAISSVLGQTYTHIEFIIIDDCSNNETSSFLSRFCNDTRVKVYRNKTNLGLTKSLNLALSLSNGKYIARMDSDDVCDSERIKRQVDFLEKHCEIGAVGTYFYLFNGQKTKKHKNEAQFPDEIHTSLFFGNGSLMHSSMMLRSSIFNAGNGFRYNSDYSKSQDYELWARVSDCVRFYVLPYYLMSYRISDGQISNSCSAEQIMLRNTIMEKQLRVLYPNPSLSQIELHFSFCVASRVKSVSELRDWCRLLIKLDSERREYPPIQFEYYVRRRELRSCLKSIRGLKDLVSLLAIIPRAVKSYYLYAIERKKQSRSFEGKND